MTGSVRSCCVPKCAKTRADNIVLHKFPDPIDDKERFVSWVNAVGSSISSLDHQYIYKNRKICHNHFEEKYLTWTRKLCFGAVPTLGLPQPDELTKSSNDDVKIDVNDDDDDNNDYCTDPLNTESTQNDVKPIVPLITIPKMPEISDNSLEPSQPLKVKICPNCICPIQTDDCPLVTLDVVRNAVALKELRPKYRSIYRRYIRQEARLQKLRKTKREMFDLLTQNLNIIAKNFFQTQINLKKAKHKGIRFSPEEKILALSIMKLSSPCYELLKKVFILPSLLTLRRLYTSITGLQWDGTEKQIENMLDNESKLSEDSNDDERGYIVENEIIEQQYVSNDLMDQLGGSEFIESQYDSLDDQPNPTEAEENQDLIKEEILQTPLDSLLNTIIHPKPKISKKPKAAPKQDETVAAVVSISGGFPEMSVTLKHNMEMNQSQEKKRTPKQVNRPIILQHHTVEMKSPTHGRNVETIPSEGIKRKILQLTKAPIRLSSQNINEKSPTHPRNVEINPYQGKKIKILKLTKGSPPNLNESYESPKEHSSDEVTFSTRHTGRLSCYDMPQL